MAQPDDRQAQCDEDRPLLAIASDVSSTGGIRVLDNGTRGTISPTLSLRLLGTCPLISLDLFFRG